MAKEYAYFRSGELLLPADIWVPFVEEIPPRRHSQGEILYLQGTGADQFYYIAQGKVKTYISSGQGEERILTVYRAGDILGEAAFFDEQPRVSSAVTLTPCQIVSIDGQRVRAVLSARPELALAVIKYLARTVRLLSGHVDGAFLQADKRIARHLLSLPLDGRFIQCTQEEIGASVGVSRVTVSRVLRAFVNAGWVSTNYGSVELLDPKALNFLLNQ